MGAIKTISNAVLGIIYEILFAIIIMATFFIITGMLILIVYKL